MIGTLAAIGTVLVAGAGAFALLRPRRTTDPLEVAGLSFLLGSVVISLLLFGLGGIVRQSGSVVVVAGLATVLGRMAWTRLRVAPWQAVPFGYWTSGLLLVLFLGVAWQALATPFGSDGIFNFEDRARFGWLNGGQIPLQFYSDPSRMWHHASYPPLISLNQLWLYLCLGEPHQEMAKILGAFWWAASAMITLSQINRLTGEPVRGWIAIGIMLGVPAIVFARGGAVWGWGDFPVGATATAAALYLAEYRERRTGLAVFGALLAMLPWIKREGIILAVVLFAAFLWNTRKDWAWRRWAAVGLPFVLVASGWTAFTKWAQCPPVGDFVPPTPSFFLDHLDRIPRILTIASAELGVWQRWSLLWVMLLPATWLILRTPALKPWRWLLGSIALLVAGYAGLYVFSTWANIIWHMLTSYPRLLVAPAMMAGVLIAVSVPLRKPQPASTDAGSPAKN